LSDSILISKSKEFALEIITVCNTVKKEEKESVLTNQLLRSGTSIGANIREAFYAHGKADFIAKLQIALKECSESEYWLELLIESGFYNDNKILNDCIEIKKMLVSSINTAKKNIK
jgi:four helix bundle protein